jgi:hypothetical protein
LIDWIPYGLHNNCIGPLIHQRSHKPLVQNATSTAEIVALDSSCHLPLRRPFHLLHFRSRPAANHRDWKCCNPASHKRCYRCSIYHS